MKHFATVKPSLAPEHDHSGPGDRRINRQCRRQLCRNGLPAPDQLHPCEHDEQQESRPHSQPLRIMSPKAEHRAVSPAAIEFLSQCEGGVPWIDGGPDISQAQRHKRQSDPADHPHHHRRDVANGIVISVEAGYEDEREQAQPNCARNEHQRAHEALIDAQFGFPASSFVLPQKQSEADEGQGYGCAGSPDVERQWDRQVIALTETMRHRRRHASGGEEMSDSSNQRPAQWPHSQSRSCNGYRGFLVNARERPSRILRRVATTRNHKWLIRNPTRRVRKACPREGGGEACAPSTRSTASHGAQSLSLCASYGPTLPRSSRQSVDPDAIR